MNKKILKDIILKEIRSILKEEYQDKYKMVGTLITNLDERPQKEVYSDIRAIPGITVISSIEPIPYSEQNTSQFKTTLTVKVDGYPWIAKGGFTKDKMLEIASQIRKVPGVKAYAINPEEIVSI
jgi:cell division protein FtsX